MRFGCGLAMRHSELEICVLVVARHAVLDHGEWVTTGGYSRSNPSHGSTGRLCTRETREKVMSSLFGVIDQFSIKV